MTRYEIYLEIGAEGECLAHVPALPGCNLRAASRDAALAGLPGAVRAHLAWLRAHGEPCPGAGAVSDRFEVAVAGESRGAGPFTPGDPAALLAPDLEPLDDDALEALIRLMGHSRADLLALVRALPDELLDWQPEPDAFSIRRILRHVGNAEEWYVSRLVAPDTLPPGWEHDDELPILDFLAMERRTAVERLRRLSGEERRAVVYPTHWTSHPDEAWTARKALRRFLEHEREHTGQVRRVLEARRGVLLGRMAAARAALLARVDAWDERAIAARPVLDTWTIKDILAHIAAWDRWSLDGMQRVAGGRPPDLSLAHDEDAFNAVHVAAWRERSLADVLAELKAARAAVLDWLEPLPAAELLSRRVVGGEDWSFPAWIDVYARHDEEHAAHVAAASLPD